MDSIKPLPPSEGCDSILVIVCRLTKMALFVPTVTTLTAKGLARLFMEKVFSKHGTPINIVSDRGSKFTSKVWRDFNKALSIKQSLSTAFHPETDGQTERVNSSPELYLQAHVNYDQDDWAKWLPLAEFAYNNATHSATGVLLFFANYGRHPTFDVKVQLVTNKQLGVQMSKLHDLHEHIKGKMAIAQEVYKRYADQRRLPAPAYKKGDRVFLNMRNICTTRPTAKLANKRTGPYEITEVISKNVVRLKLPWSFSPTHPSFNVALLEPAPGFTIPGRKEALPDPVTVDKHNEWGIVKILESRYHGNKLQYRFLWLGYEDDDNEQQEWYPAINAEHAPDLVAAFHAAHPEAASPTHRPVKPRSQGTLRQTRGSLQRVR
jgi:hypothetical protein